MTARAHVDARANSASESIGAEAYTLGHDVAFRSLSPDLHTAAHEAVHTIQQRSGAKPAGGTGRPGDSHERQADAIADRVVSGRSVASDVAALQRGASNPARVLQKRAALLERDGEGTERRYAASSEGREEYEEGGYYYWNAEMDRQERIRVGDEVEDYAEAVAENDVATDLPQPLPGHLGYPSYYRGRHEDFVRRHPDGASPPSYYLDYGLKYALRFTNELFPKLSPQGQRWLLRARTNLQLAIENSLLESQARFTVREENDSRFTRFAFDSHPKAYLDAGLLDLPVADHLRIALTPDLGDSLSLDGLVQIGAIAPEIAERYADRVGGSIEDTIEDALSDYYFWLSQSQHHRLY